MSIISCFLSSCQLGLKSKFGNSSTHHEEILYDALFPSDMRKRVCWIRFHCQMRATSCGKVFCHDLGHALCYLQSYQRRCSDLKLPVVKRLQTSFDVHALVACCMLSMVMTQTALNLSLNCQPYETPNLNQRLKGRMQKEKTYKTDIGTEQITNMN